MADETRITIKDMKYDPDPAEVKAGGKVIWTNEDPMGHTATREDSPCAFDTGVISPGQSATVEFSEPCGSEIEYFCTIHAGMTGMLRFVP